MFFQSMWNTKYFTIKVKMFDCTKQIEYLKKRLFHFCYIIWCITYTTVNPESHRSRVYFQVYYKRFDSLGNLIDTFNVSKQYRLQTKLEEIPRSVKLHRFHKQKLNNTIRVCRFKPCYNERLLRRLQNLNTILKHLKHQNTKNGTTDLLYSICLILNGFIK